MPRKTILVLLFSLCLFAKVAVAGDTATGEAVSSKELFEQGIDEIKRKYGDGFITVTGVAVEVGPDVFGLPSVTLSDAPGGTHHVLCVLPYSDYLKLGDIEKDKEITMSGSPRGKTAEGMLVMKQSVVVPQ